MMERMIGVASRAVRVDWRRKRVGFGVVGSRLLELNNFSSGVWADSCAGPWAA